jgi:hypothetical protein
VQECPRGGGQAQRGTWAHGDRESHDRNPQNDVQGPRENSDVN